MMVSTAVVGAPRPPTVPQIGRSLGPARQVIQRAANQCSDLRDERRPDAVPDGSLYNIANFPTRQELARYYAAGTGRDISSFDYYLVLAMFKAGCILEYKVAQAAAGILSKETGELFSGLVLKNFAEAAQLVSGHS